MKHTLSFNSLPNHVRSRPGKLITLGLASVALVSIGRAVSPPPDGGYPNANTAEGDQGLYSLTTGADNTAVGFNALFSDTTGSSNTSVGFYSLANNTTGGFNTGYGQFALQSNGTGAGNTAVGYNTLFNNTTGNSNVALGASAGVNLTTGNANIDIANPGVAGESQTIRLGAKQTHRATYIAGISGTTVGGGVGVVIDTNGRLGTITSSACFKDQIKPMDKASEAILALQPVTFRYKPELDPEGTPQFGLVAEQVAKINPDLVARDEQGSPYTVRYEAVNAMLLNEFLKEHRKGQVQEKINAQLKSAIAQLQAIVKEQAAQLQKVSARLTADRPAPRLVGNDQ